MPGLRGRRRPRRCQPGAGPPRRPTRRQTAGRHPACSGRSTPHSLPTLPVTPHSLPALPVSRVTQAEPVAGLGHDGPGAAHTAGSPTRARRRLRGSRPLAGSRSVGRARRRRGRRVTETESRRAQQSPARRRTRDWRSGPPQPTAPGATPPPVAAAGPHDPRQNVSRGRTFQSGSLWQWLAGGGIIAASRSGSGATRPRRTRNGCGYSRAAARRSESESVPDRDRVTDTHRASAPTLPAARPTCARARADWANGAWVPRRPWPGTGSRARVAGRHRRSRRRGHAEATMRARAGCTARPAPPGRPADPAAARPPAADPRAPRPGGEVRGPGRVVRRSPSPSRRRGMSASSAEGVGRRRLSPACAHGLAKTTRRPAGAPPATTPPCRLWPGRRPGRRPRRRGARGARRRR